VSLYGKCQYEGLNVDDRYFTAAQAAEALGISISTLYVYVGRKGIRSQAISGSKQRRYWRPDIERLRKNGKSLPQASLDLTVDSELTLLTEDDVFYRGRSAISLAETASFESVAALLWNADEAQTFSRPAPSPPKLFAPLDKLMSEQRDVDRATALFPIFEAADIKSYDLTPLGMAHTGVDVLRWLATLTVRAKVPCGEPIHLFVARHLKRSKEEADLIRRLLVLCADHGFESGTLAVRAAASAGVTPWRAVITGLSVSSGRHGRLAGYDATHRFLKEIAVSADPHKPVIQRLRDGEPLPGFDPPLYRHGEPIYRRGDPRARALLAYCSKILRDDESFGRLQKALTLVREIRNLEPNNALVCLYLFQRFGLDSHSTLFHLSRAAGWIGHAIEQHQAGEIQHRRGLYSGPLPA
jgi:citrate synthase